MKENFKNKKGITLIALIITIVILLILTVVSINILKNQEIIFQSKGAVKQHQIAEEKEQIDLVYSYYKMEKITDPDYTLQQAFNDNNINATVVGEETWTITFNNTGNSYKITDGQVTLVGNSEDLELLQRYFLTANKEGQELDEVYDKANNKFINNSIIKNAEQDIQSAGLLDKVLMIKYNNKYYKVNLVKEVYNMGSLTEYTVTLTDSVEYYGERYILGQKVKFSYDGTKDNETDWYVIKDNDNTIDIISGNAIGTFTVDSSNYDSYISDIDIYCKGLVTNSKAIKVRSVGSNPNNPLAEADKDYQKNYYSTISYYKNGDDNYKSDTETLRSLELIKADNDLKYLLASRELNKEIVGVNRLGVRSISTTGELEFNYIYYFYKSIDTSSVTSAVRPIVTVSSDILK